MVVIEFVVVVSVCMGYSIKLTLYQSELSKCMQYKLIVWYKDLNKFVDYNFM